MENLQQASDEALMHRYGEGSAAAFSELYGRHKGPLFRFMLRSCDSQAVAEELFQDVWTSVIRSRSRYEATAKFSTWLYRIASNRLVDHYRQQGRWNPYLEEGLDGEAEQCAATMPNEEPERQADLNAQIRRLLECLQQLPPAQRQVFLLKEEAGLALEAIAATLGINREAAKSRMRYAIGKLRICMGGEA